MEEVRTDMEYEVVELMIERLSDDLHERYMRSTYWGDEDDYTPKTEEIPKLLEEDIKEFVELCKKLGFNKEEILEFTETIKHDSSDYLSHR